MKALFEDCKKALEEIGFSYHKMDSNKKFFAGRMQVSGCIVRYNPRSKKTMMVYFGNDFSMLKYAVKKKYFALPEGIDMSTKFLRKNEVKHFYIPGTSYTLNGETYVSNNSGI